MAEHQDGAGWESSSRGEAAWKETRERVASRNAEARKNGKQEREAYDKARADARVVAEAREHSELLKRHHR